MEDPDIAAYVLKVYDADGASGKKFIPKSHLPYAGQDYV